MTLSKVCFIIATVIFGMVAVDFWPHVLEDFQPLGLGLAFFAAGHAV